MNIFKRFRRTRTLKKVRAYINQLGHLIGWNIVSKEIEDLYHRDPQLFVDELNLVITNKEMQFYNILVALSDQCKRHRIPIQDKPVLTLLRCSTGSRIIITEYNPVIEQVMAFNLIYRGVAYTAWKEESTLEFNVDTFAKMFSTVREKFSSPDARLQTVRHLNWMFCTINDIDERIKNWEVKWTC